MTESKYNPHDVPLEIAASVAQALRGLRKGVGSERPVLISDLVGFLSGHRDGELDRINAAVGESADLARLFSALVRQNRAMHAPRLVAAQTSSEVTERHGSRFRVLLRASNANSSQVYVIVEIDPLAPIQEGQPVSLLVEKGDAMVASRFPDLHDQRTQIIVDRHSDLCTLLRDPDSEISIINVKA